MRAFLLSFSLVVLGCLDHCLADRLLVVSKAQSQLSIIDPATLKVQATVPVGHSPHEVCTSADGKLAFVSSYGSTVPGNTISIIDIEAGKELKRVDLGSLRRPHGMAEYAGKIYFTAEHNAAVGRLDPVSGSVDLVLGTGQLGTHMIVADAKDGRLITSNVFSDSITLLNPQGGPAGGLSLQHIPVVGQPEGIALAPDGVALWIAPRTGGSIQVIDSLSGKVLDTIRFDGVAIRLAFTTDGSKVLVSDAKSNAVVVFDARTRTRAFQIETKQTPVGLVVSPDGKKCYVSCGTDHTVQVIDLAARKVVGEVDAGSVPDGIAYSSATIIAKKKPGSLGVALEQQEAGAIITKIVPGSAAEKANIQVGDRVVSIDGQLVTSTQVFVQRVGRFGAGEEVHMVLDRGGKLIDLTVTLGERRG